MTVNLTRIYTRLGDGGQTHLGDMSRVAKTDPRVEAYGTVDELNALIGLTRLQPDLPPRFEQWLARVQNDLLDVGADLCVPGGGGALSPSGQSAAGPEPGADAPQEAPRQADSSEPPVSPERSRLRVSEEYTAWLEEACDEVNAGLPPLRSFVIPGGTPAAAHLHVSRTVGPETNAEVVRYLNRLSDLLFILARGVGEGDETLWDPGAHHGTGTADAAH